MAAQQQQQQQDAAKRDLDLQQHLSTGEKNPRGIPTVVFIVSLLAVCAAMRRGRPWIDRIGSRTAALTDGRNLTTVNHPSVPIASTQDDVEAFLQERLGGVAAETAIGAFNELYS